MPRSWPTAVLAIALFSADARAQLAPPNAAGLTLHHVHLTVTNVEEHLAFWTTAMGGTRVATAAVPTTPGAETRSFSAARSKEKKSTANTLSSQ